MEFNRKEKMPRTILVHFNIEIPDNDTRTEEDIARGAVTNITGGSTTDLYKSVEILGGRLAGAFVTLALAEEV